MKKLLLLSISISFFAFVLVSNVFAQTAQTQVACKYDWDCRHLDHFVKLDQNVCVGPEKVFDGRSDPILPRRGYVFLD
ncbi:MAG: hypothetical protein J7J87_02040, partial [Candidatus Diapherotrites archaeon]|nr:hypothetical protein [Candidatus Diapherotrites archaeon]